MLCIGCQELFLLFSRFMDRRCSAQARLWLYGSVFPKKILFSVRFDRAAPFCALSAWEERGTDAVSVPERHLFFQSEDIVPQLYRCKMPMADAFQTLVPASGVVLTGSIPVDSRRNQDAMVSRQTAMSETHSAVPERSSEKLRTTPQPINKTDASGTMTAALSRRFLSLSGR